jgi:CO/xanthine dehydrogenase Mo-binding subunit
VLTVWSTTQVVHWVQAQLSRALKLPESCVRVIAPDVGGGLGLRDMRIQKSCWWRGWLCVLTNRYVG